MSTFGRIAAVGVLTASLFTAVVPTAQADVAGAYGSTDWNLRASASTTARVIVRVHALGKGTPDSVACHDPQCRGQKTGDSYKCSTGGGTYNTWTPLLYNGKKGWVADQCVTLGRIA
ncbi:hypothetical protein ACGFRB_00655 [Streptomyces sp. NPDC048718]|uniref:hypothetical protein n=1 Tax=Streptomyces sp. NPDC048718 TaxID=3365587 RepID=UPI0037193F4A